MNRFATWSWTEHVGGDHTHPETPKSGNAVNVWRLPRQTITCEARLPSRNKTRVASQLIHDRSARGPLVQQKDRPRTPLLTYGDRATALYGYHSDSFFRCTFES